ncbi:hypothetical protein WJX79_003028 [Trebouxia sp. C0005]
MATPTSSPDTLQAGSSIAGAFHFDTTHCSQNICSRKRIAATDVGTIATSVKRQRRKTPLTAHAVEAANAASSESDPDSCWYGDPIAQDLAHARWGRVYGAATAVKKQTGFQVYDNDAVVAHYNFVEVSEVGKVGLGDFVEVYSGKKDADGNERPYIMEVTELFEDVQGGHYFTGHWFYSLWNTALAVTSEDGSKVDPVFLEPHRIFRASQHDNQAYATEGCTTQPLNTIARRVTVKHVRPGWGDPGTCDYWWNQEHDNRFFSFSDKYPPGSQPAFLKTVSAGLPRKLQAVDLYCGCGGMSFIDQKTDKVQIKTQWAVDSVQAMCQSFQVNYPDATVRCMGVDEWLMLCKKFKQLSDRFPESWTPDDDKAEEDAADADEDEEDQRAWDVEDIVNVRIADNAKRGTQGQDKGNLLEALRDSNCWLEFKVKWEGWCSRDSPDGTTWEHEKSLNCDEILFKFVCKVRREKHVPLPGDIDIVIGGPPCQGVTGLNRHAVKVDIRDDSRNRQMEAFYDVVLWFQPGFVLMENVVDTLHKEDGMYAKSAMGSLLLLNYQVRMGIIAACDQGVPQIRNRVFMWGAKSGVEQLPPFPEPSHTAPRSRHTAPRSVTDLCKVKFQSPASEKKAFAVPVLGDMLSDLPDISSSTLSERARYKSDPQTPYQHFLRRQPRGYESSMEARAVAADKAMQRCHDMQRSKLCVGRHSFGGIEQIGAKFACKRMRSNYHQATWDSMLAACRQEYGAKEAEARQLEMAAATKALHFSIGQEALASLDAAKLASGPLRDHRSLCHHLDDQLRICQIPKVKGANFRSFPVVVWPAKQGTNLKGQVCAGHTHAPRLEGKSSCPAGGTSPKGKAKAKDGLPIPDHPSKPGCGVSHLWRGTHLEGCPSRTVFLPTGAAVCPHFSVMFRGGTSSGGTGSYGRLWYDEMRCTVIGRAAPHNIAMLHPDQDRVMSIRENARMQGFPDYFALVGLGNQQAGRYYRNATLDDRYQQMGNAVSPCVASALGRCLLLAAVAEAPPDVDHAVVAVPDPELLQSWAESKSKGLQTYTQQQASKHSRQATGRGAAGA